MDLFRLRDEIVREYAHYVQGFLKIRDAQIHKFVKRHLDRGAFWPEPLVQLNPSYAYGETLRALIQRGQLDHRCEAVFGNLRFYRHQQEAIERALTHRHFIVSSGTGSGKTLTYLIPIYDWIFRHASPNSARVCAIVVYPMNALVNSQYEALRRYAEQYRRITGQECPVRFARLTGQESLEEKERLRNAPPHILLTNFMMLELMLVRPEDRPFVDRTMATLQFLVLDELHAYRGRQGADVALLVRRLRERCGNPNLLCIGTSATLATADARPVRQQKIAEVASKIFGVDIDPKDVVEETLRRMIPLTRPLPPEQLKAAVLDDRVPESWETLSRDPLAAWIEDHFGLVQEEDGNLRRCPPITLSEGARRLSEITGIDITRCRNRLKAYLLAGSQIQHPEHPEGLPVFGLRLHQFISQGGTVFATLEPPPARKLSLSGQSFADEDRFMFPLGFCRECGQEYYYAVWKTQERRVEPRPPFPSSVMEIEGIPGYIVLNDSIDWENDVEHLPDHWCDENGKVRPYYRSKLPILLYVDAQGRVHHKPGEEANGCWFLPYPFPLCLNCGQVYDGREKEFRKLGTLATGGRSTSTTVIIMFTLHRMQHEESIPPDARKVLSFTDNRQDAALQAGHFNDFVQTTLIRAALLKVLNEKKTLRFDELPDRVYDALHIPFEHIAKDPHLDPTSPAGRKTIEVFKDWIQYRLY